MSITADDSRHGSPRGYRAGCKQRCCLDAQALYERRTSKLRAMGRRGRLDPIGSKRRIQALQALGWPLARIAAAGGFASGSAVDKMLRDSTAWVFPATAQKARRAYDALSMTPGPSPLVQGRARAKNWPPPLAWDDDTIDDPDAQPWRPTVRRRPTSQRPVDEVLVQRALSGHRVAANPAERRLVIEGWRDAGRSLRELDEIQGWNAFRDLREAS